MRSGLRRTRCCATGVRLHVARALADVMLQETLDVFEVSEERHSYAEWTR